MAPPDKKRKRNPWDSSKGKAVNPKAPVGGGGQGGFSSKLPLNPKRNAKRPLPDPQSPVGRNTAPIDSARDTSVPPPPALDMGALMAERARELVGKPVISDPMNGDGQECYDMVDKMLTDLGARSARDYGRISPNADYKWGKLVPLKDVKPGDVLQFRNYNFKILTHVSIKGTQTDGRLFTQPGDITDPRNRGHHSSVVLSVNPDGTLEVVEQHVINHDTGDLYTTIRQNTLQLKDSSTTTTKNTMKDGAKVEITTTITIKIDPKGVIWAYRPVEKK